jgi:UDP-N-acetylglucosamine 3-dehydrogenase
VLRFASGTIGYVEGSWRYREFRTDLEVSGSGGLIQLDNRSTATSRFDLELPEAVRAAYPDGLEEGPYEAQIREVAAWMAGGPAPRHSAEEAREALRIGLAAVESLRSGRPVTL